MTLAGLRVLLVEDEPAISMLIEEYLEEHGCIVAVVSRLREAITLASTLDLDVGVLDINLAGELSYPVAEVLQARHVPFLFATGYGTGGAPDHMKDAPVLPKPYRVEQLRKRMIEVSAAAH